MQEPQVIWIIDDDLVSLYATRYRIGQTKTTAKVFDFDTAEIALEYYEKALRNKGQLPDIIFLDLIMPGINGWQFLETLKSMKAHGKVPNVYVLSSFSNSKDRRLAKEHASILGYFDKPISKLDMERTLLSFENDAL
ncbi:MAG: response regulator [Pricia sp.]